MWHAIWSLFWIPHHCLIVNFRPQEILSGHPAETLTQLFASFTVNPDNVAQLSGILNIREFNFQKYYDTIEEQNSRCEDILSLCQANSLLHKNLITPGKLTRNPAMAHYIFADGLIKPINVLPTARLKTDRWTKASCLGLAKFIMGEQRDQIQSVLWLHSCTIDMPSTLLEQLLDVVRPLLTSDLLFTPTAYFVMLHGHFEQRLDRPTYDVILQLEEHDPGLHRFLEELARPFGRLAGREWGHLGWPERYFGLIMKTYKRLIREEQVGIDPLCLPVLLIASRFAGIPEDLILKRFSIHSGTLQQLKLSPLCAKALFQHVPHSTLKSLGILSIVEGVLAHSFSLCPVELLKGPDRYIRWRHKITAIVSLENMPSSDPFSPSEMSYQELEELLLFMTDAQGLHSKVILNDAMSAMIYLPDGQVGSVSDAFIHYARYAVKTTGFLAVPGTLRPAILLIEASWGRWNIFIIAWAYMLVHRVRLDLSSICWTIPDEAAVCEFAYHFDYKPGKLDERHFKNHIVGSCKSYGLHRLVDFGTLRGMLHIDNK